MSRSRRLGLLRGRGLGCRSVPSLSCRCAVCRPTGLLSSGGPSGLSLPSGPLSGHSGPLSGGSLLGQPMQCLLKSSIPRGEGSIPFRLLL